MMSPNALIDVAVQQVPVARRADQVVEALEAELIGVD